MALLKSRAVIELAPIDIVYILWDVVPKHFLSRETD